MARPLQVLSLLSRHGALSLMPSVSTVNACRFASRGAIKAWMGQRHVHRDRVSDKRASRYSDDMSDDELEEVEDKIQALIDEQSKERKTVKYHILRRKMTPKGAPQRKLSWDAMEQIRYLKQEQPEEWTVERLARGYSVTPDVILRVLRSKFVPAPDRKVKQDAKVMARLGQQVLPSGAAGTGQHRLKLPGHHTPAVLPCGSNEGAVVAVADKTLMLRGENSLAKSPAAPVTPLPSRVRARDSKDVIVTMSSEEVDSTSNRNPTEEDEESWDGRLMTDEELEEFMEMEEPHPVVQVGNDFFDAEGNFLYRI